MMKTALMILLIMITALSVEAAPAAIDKSNDAELQAMINETVPKFSQLNYSEGGNNLPCNLFLPEGYPGTEKYPLVIFLGDAGAEGDGTDAPLRQGYGGIIWASNADQTERKCLVLVPQYPHNIAEDKTGATAASYITMTENLIRAVIDGFQVNGNKVYVTGQSMGCMAMMIITEKNPDLFAAELFVAGRRDPKSIDGLRKQKFFHVVAEGDTEAAAAQVKLVRMLQAAGIPISRTYEWNAKMSQDEFSKAIRVILSGHPTANFARFINGTVLPPGVSGSEAEHLYSFDAAYRIDALRDWMFMQEKFKR